MRHFRKKYLYLSSPKTPFFRAEIGGEPLKYYPAHENTAARQGIVRGLFPYHNNSGSVLIITIWILVFFSILSAGLYSITSAYITLFRRLEDRFVSRYLAEAACLNARAQRKNDKTMYDTISELRTEKEQELGRGKFVYRLIDEESKLNINTAAKDILARLPGVDAELADRIVTSELKPFHLKEELLAIEGVTEEKYDRFKDYITVYTDGEVNINTAPPEVLQTLGMSDSLVRAVQEFRAGPDGKEGTDDDEAFTNTGEIVAKLRSLLAFSQEEEAVLVQLISQGLLVVSSKYFTVDCEIKILNRSAMKYAIVIAKDKIKQWREF